MVQVSTKRRAVSEDQNDPNSDGELENIPSSIFDALRDHPLAPQAQGREDSDGPQGKQKEQGVTVTVEDLFKEVNDLRAQLARTQTEQNFQVLTPQVEVLPTAPKEISYDGLPDPVLDQAGFTKGLIERISKQQKDERAYENAQAQTQNSRKEKYDALMSDFSDDHPEMVEDERKLEFAVRSVADRARNRGVDLDRYMFGQRDRFMGDVAKEYESIFGPVEQDVEELEEEIPTRRRPGRPSKADIQARSRGKRTVRRTLGEDDEGRTGGIFGGQESGGARSDGSQKAPNGDMVTDLRELQKKSGFY